MRKDLRVQRMKYVWKDFSEEWVEIVATENHDDETELGIYTSLF